MDERERIMKDIFDKGNEWNVSKGSSVSKDEEFEDASEVLGFFADYILADRKRVLDEIDEALYSKQPIAGEGCECNAYGSCECGCGVSWLEPAERQRDLAVKVIARLRGLKGEK